MNILIITPQRELATTTANYLTTENYSCEVAENAQEALMKIQQYNYDCILLDVMIPENEGLQLLKKIKTDKPSTGIIAMVARNAVSIAIQGLQMGADDYFFTPFHLTELLARLRALLRRKQLSTEQYIQHGEIYIDLLTKRLQIRNQEVKLTKTEFELLLFLVRNPNEVLSKSKMGEYLSNATMGKLDNYDFVYTHVKNLKRKLTQHGADDYLQTVYGIGYKWSI